MGLPFFFCTSLADKHVGGVLRIVSRKGAGKRTVVLCFLSFKKYSSVFIGI